MKELMKKIKNFLSDKKNRKIVIVSLIGVVTVIGIVLGISFAPASSSNDLEKSSALNNEQNITANSDSFNGTEQMQDLKQQNLNSTVPNQGANGGNTSGAKDATSSIKSLDENSNNQMGGTSLDNGGGNAGAFAFGNDAPPAAVNCTIAIDCSSISGNGVLSAAGNPQLELYAARANILSPVSMTIVDTSGDGRVGVDEAIRQACDANGIQYEFKGSSYLRGMNYLYEFNAGPNSGWMYKVNGRIPSIGCNAYYLKGGEDILWYYVISY